MTCTYSPEAYVFSSEENHALLEAETNELLHFGHNFPAPQGGSYWLDDTGNPDLTQNIHTWITCRMAHVYSLGFLHGEPGAAELVDKAIAGLRGPLHDDENGGWYPSISADGSTHEAGKVCYAHAFVILAATSAKLIGRPDADELLEEALATYDKHFWDDEIGLAVDTWNTEFTELDSYRASMPICTPPKHSLPLPMWPETRNTASALVVSSIMWSDGQPTITGVFLSISPPIGSRISNATMTSRMTSSSRTAPLRAMASSGHVSSPSMR